MTIMKHLVGKSSEISVRRSDVRIVPGALWQKKFFMKT